MFVGALGESADLSRVHRLPARKRLHHHGECRGDDARAFEE